ncbi:MAG: permease-like cell division protein FtsX [Muribaculaceae bacterium]|nr:permease-like cell division protein FtsX [Muribaculaceae bacterium]
MKKEKEVKLSYWAHHLTTVISVTLVLLLLGIAAMLWFAAASETRRVKERFELSAVLEDSIPAQTQASLEKWLSAQPYVNTVTAVSKEQALELWKSETDEDLYALFGVNPLSAEVDFTLKADYTTPAAIKKITRAVSARPGVESVSSPDSEMIESMNRNVEQLTWILGGAAAMMILISLVLINNTVHLSIYARRFTIHTMQLVGATNAFIRRPVVLGNLGAGLISGLLASGILAATLAALQGAGTGLSLDSLGWVEYGMTAGGMILLGMTLCSIAAWISASVYLRKDYDALFR